MYICVCACMCLCTKFHKYEYDFVMILIIFVDLVISEICVSIPHKRKDNKLGLKTSNIPMKIYHIVIMI